MSFNVVTYQRAWYKRNCSRLVKERQLYYLKHKAGFAARNNLLKLRGREFLYSHKNVSCADCKKKFPPVCMDFDHRPGVEKLFDIGPNVGLSKTRLTKEIAKCDVVCACCHRLRTQRRKSERKAVKG